jgi:hypothetical protein
VRDGRIPPHAEGANYFGRYAYQRWAAETCHIGPYAAQATAFQHRFSRCMAKLASQQAGRGIVEGPHPIAATRSRPNAYFRTPGGVRNSSRKRSVRFQPPGGHSGHLLLEHQVAALDPEAVLIFSALTISTRRNRPICQYHFDTMRLLYATTAAP